MKRKLENQSNELEPPIKKIKVVKIKVKVDEEKKTQEKVPKSRIFKVPKSRKIKKKKAKIEKCKGCEKVIICYECSGCSKDFCKDCLSSCTDKCENKICYECLDNDSNYCCKCGGEFCKDCLSICTKHNCGNVLCYGCLECECTNKKMMKEKKIQRPCHDCVSFYECEYKDCNKSLCRKCVNSYDSRCDGGFYCNGCYNEILLESVEEDY